MSIAGKKIAAAVLTLGLILGGIFFFLTAASSGQKDKTPEADSERGRGHSPVQSSRLKKSLDSAASGRAEENVRIQGCVSLSSGMPADALVSVISEADLSLWNMPHIEETGHKSAVSCDCAAAKENLLRLEESEMPLLKPAAEIRTQADSGGCFDFTAAVSEPYAVFARGMDGTGFASARGIKFTGKSDSFDAEEKGSAEEDEEQVDLILSAPILLSGKVIDAATMSPLEGVRVIAFGTAYPFKETAVSDDQGAFVFPEIPFSEYRIMALADGYAAAFSDIRAEDAQASEATGKIVIQLNRPCSVEGRVVDARGRAVSGASVRISNESKGFSEETQSGEDGSFLFSDVPSAIFSASVAAFRGSMSSTRMVDLGERCLADGRKIEDRAGSSDSGSEKKIILTLLPGIRVEGQIVDAKGNVPLAGAKIAVHSVDVAGNSAVSSENGTYRIEGVFPGSSISASARGYRTREIFLPTDIQAGETSKIDFSLEKLLEISGKVLPPPGQKGLPGGLMVGLLQANKEQFVPVSDSGTFSFYVDNANAAELEVHHSSAGHDFAVVKPPADDVVLQLKRGAAVICRALDPSGNPLKAAVLRASYGTPQSRENDESAFLTDEPPGKDGSMLLAGLKPGIYNITLSSPGFAPEKIRDVMIVDDDETKNLGDIRVSAGMTFSGRVINKQSEPVSGAEILVETTANGERASGRSDNDGNFKITGLSTAGSVILFASKGKAYSKLLEINPNEKGADGIELILITQKKHIIAGNVVDADTGSPVTSFKVFDESFSGSSDGRFEVEYEISSHDEDVESAAEFDADSRSVFVSILAPGYANYFEKHSLSSGDFTDLGYIKLSRGISIEGRVEKSDGTPVPGIIVLAREKPSFSSMVSFATSRPDGTFLLTGIPDTLEKAFIFGRHSDKGEPTWVSVDIPPGEKNVRGVVLRLNDFGAIEGYVRDSRGNPIEGASIFNAAVRNVRTVSDKDGYYRLENISVSAVMPHIIMCQSQSRSGVSNLVGTTVYLRSADEPLRVDFDVTAQNATGNLEVSCAAEGARHVILIPEKVTAQDDFVELRTAPILNGIARFENVSAGKYLAKALNPASVQEIGSVSVEITSGGSTRAHIEERR